MYDILPTLVKVRMTIMAKATTKGASKSATRKPIKKLVTGLSSEQKSQVLSLIEKHTKSLERDLLSAKKEIAKLKEKHVKAGSQVQKATAVKKKAPAKAKAKTAAKPGRKPQSKFAKAAKKALHSVEHAVGLE